MKIIRKARRLKRRTRRATLAIVGAIAVAVLGGCGLVEQNGDIREVERGKNGVKVEYKMGNNEEEVYLVPDSPCTDNDNINDCADQDDYLVPPRGYKAGKDN